MAVDDHRPGLVHAEDRLRRRAEGRYGGKRCRCDNKGEEKTAHCLHDGVC